MARIELGKGYFAIVDDAELEELSKFKWTTRGKGRSVYAYRSAAKNHDGLGAISMHRFIAGDTKYYVDHINGNTLDNRRENLRIVTPCQNSANRRKRASTTSVYIGVQAHGDDGWKAVVSHEGKHHQSYHETEIEAAVVRDMKARELFGEFATMNFPFNGERGAVMVSGVSNDMVRIINEIYASYKKTSRIWLLRDKLSHQAKKSHAFRQMLVADLKRMLEENNAKPMVGVRLPKGGLCHGEATAQKRGRGGACCSGRG